jgi:phosphoenolpyruvate carboxykinase (GTP)
VGIVPNPKDIDMSGLDLPAENMTKLLSVNAKDWVAEIDAIGQFFETFGTRLPDEMWKQNDNLRARVLAASK